MKQVFYILLTGALLGLTSAGCHRGQAQDGLKTTTDSVVKKTAWGNYKIVFDVPESDNRWLENAVIEYASETLGGTYAADASHVREMLEAYGDSIAREYDGIGKELMEVHTPGDTIKMEFEARITKRCEAPGWVTLRRRVLCLQRRRSRNDAGRWRDVPENGRTPHRLGVFQTV